MTSHAIARHPRALARSIRTVALTGVLLALTAALALGAGATGGRYAGHTAQHAAVTLTVSGSEIRTAQIGWSAHCTSSGQTVHNITRFAGVTLRGASFATTTASAQPIATGYRARFAERAQGHFAGRRVTGTFAGTLRVYRTSTGQQVDICRSGTVTFSAVRG